MKYESETRVVPFGNRSIRIENLTPVLPREERERRSREVEKCLFDVFSKYSSNGTNSAI